MNENEKTYTVSEKSWLLQTGRGWWIGSEFFDHGNIMRVVRIGKAYRPEGERDKVIDIVAALVGKAEKPARRRGGRDVK